MKMAVLIENTCGNPNCASEHGLSIYVETKRHKLLLDTGATDAFLGNAEALGIDIGKVDTVILSHGHYDHAGGLLAFAKENPNARIYMQKKALDDFYHGERYIGVDKGIAALQQLCLLDGDCKIDEELFLFSGIRGRRFWPQSNLSLKRRENGMDIQDDFSHEQCLVITEGEKKILLSGCAHNGILNVLDHYQEIFGNLPNCVVSGFHMMKKAEYTQEEIASIKSTAQELSTLNTVFYTGHCTGQAAFDLMKPVMGEKLIQIHSGMVICQKEEGIG